ncbi:MAG: hypothetical protein J5506_03210 [Prevotella sp.]|nr:hypothetical protein [Prevotella sp.]
MKKQRIALLFQLAGLWLNFLENLRVKQWGVFGAFGNGKMAWATVGAARRTVARANDVGNAAKRREWTKKKNLPVEIQTDSSFSLVCAAAIIGAGPEP